MTQYRKPTAADIGKTVEVNARQNGWLRAVLNSVRYSSGYVGFHCTLTEDAQSDLEEQIQCGVDREVVMQDARIPVTTAADELLVAADMLEECGMDGAAEVLRVAAVSAE